MLLLFKNWICVEIENGNNFLYYDICKLIENARTFIAITANKTMTVLYWKIGERINIDLLYQTLL
jgi:hypothetical protein